MNSTLNEACFTEEFFEKYLSGELSSPNSPDEIAPGAIVFFNRNTNSLEFSNELSDIFRDISVYIPIGVISSISKDKKTLKCISTYAYENELCIKDFQKSSELNFLLKNEIESRTKDIVHICGGKNEMKFYLPNKSEITEILSSDNLNVILYSLEIISSYTQNKFNTYNSFLYRNLTAISEDKKDVIFYFGGVYPDIMSNRIAYSDKQLQQESSYSVKSIDEFLELSKEDKLNIISYEEKPKNETRRCYFDYSLIYSITELKKRFSDAVYMDFAVVPFAVLNLSN